MSKSRNSSNGCKRDEKPKLKQNRISQASTLPIICNINPRSIYNKVDELKTFVEQENVDVVFLSESWERENFLLNELIEMEDFKVISNFSQRKCVGGRPAIIANIRKFDVEDLTNTVIDVPWGVEAVWSIITPKNSSNASKVRKIACCALYSKPQSKQKTLLLDHIAQAYHTLSKKYGRGLHFLIAGDTNDVKLDSILSLSVNMKQIVTDYTRTDPPAILDPVITTLSNLYQKPVCLDPLDCDDDKVGTKSDHRIVLVKPIDELHNQSARVIRKVKVRPFPASGIEQMKLWFMEQEWNELHTLETAHDKATFFQKILTEKLDEIFPVKVRTFSSDDQPWVTHKIKLLDRRRKRIYRKQRRSEKWKEADNLFKDEVKKSKSNFYNKMVADLKEKNPGQWYSALKRLSSHDQIENEVQIDEISHLSNKEQAEKILEKFIAIPNEYDALKTDDIDVPFFEKSDIPQIRPNQVWLLLTKLKTKKATISGDFPVNLIKKFAAYIAEPLTHIFNVSIERGEYPNIYKFEVCTPIPKCHPPKAISDMRNISGLLTFDKVFEKLLSQMMISDMKAKLDVCQYGNRKGISINHYLINMLDTILKALDKNSKGNINAVIANFIDWNNAFPRQCPKKGVESFIKNGVRPALIPLLVNFFQDRKMTVKWHGEMSSTRSVKGGGPQGATLGLLEYISQSNHCADAIPEEHRFRFLDDLSILEIVNLLNIGISSFNFQNGVPSDLATENQFVPGENLASQAYLDSIDEWTSNQKMKINSSKSKAMIFNFTRNHQFNTRLELDDTNIEFVKSYRLLGTVITDDLSWDLNTDSIVRKANARLQLLRKIASFGANDFDLKEIYITFVRSIVEQSVPVWHSSLTDENRTDLERIQKSAFRIILGNRYKNYQNALNLLEMDTLEARREHLCLVFAQKASKHPECKQMFPKHSKNHKMQTRNKDKFKVNHANTDRLKSASIIHMQNLLNKQK